MLDNINNSASGDSAEKMFMFSGHDKIIAEVLQSLGVFDMILPDYATAFMVELHKDPKYKDFNLEVNYIPNTDSKCIILKLTKD